MQSSSLHTQESFSHLFVKDKPALIWGILLNKYGLLPVHIGSTRNQPHLRAPHQPPHIPEHLLLRHQADLQQFHRQLEYYLQSDHARQV